MFIAGIHVGRWKDMLLFPITKRTCIVTEDFYLEISVLFHTVLFHSFFVRYG